MLAGNHADTCTVVLAQILEATKITFDGATGAPVEEQPATPEANEPVPEAEAKTGVSFKQILDDAEEPEDAELAELAEELAAGRDDADEIKRVPPPEVTRSSIRELQIAIEDRKLVGFKQPLSKAVLCGEQHIVAGRVVGCSAFAVVAIVDERKCGECEKMKSTRQLALCVAHGAAYADGEAVDPQMKFQLDVA